MNQAEAGAVRDALRRELTGRGFCPASDTVSLRGELYVRGAGVEFKHTAREAAETMYQGRWTSDLPPRFAVLPATERGTPEADFLEQAGLSALFFREEGQDILFSEMDRAVEKIGPPADGAPR